MDSTGVHDPGHDEAAIVVRGLRKAFGSTPVLKGLDLDVPGGSILGFLGPNGAGKTTTIRALLGLVRPDGGEIRLLGMPVPDGLARLRGSVGAVVDQPALYPALSGRQNMLVVRDLAGGRTPPVRVDELIELVGLSAVAKRAVTSYSYGMRQRLALAAALVTQPRLLVLDEPANGLDPAGQNQLRDLLRDIRARGATLLISSHMLAEVQQLCDRVAIIDDGRLVAAGATADLLAGSRNRWYVDAGSGMARAATGVLREAGVTVIQQEPLLVDCEDPAVVSRALGTEGIWLRELRPAQQSLEELFLSLTEGPG